MSSICSENWKDRVSEGSTKVPEVAKATTLGLALTVLLGLLEPLKAHSKFFDDRENAIQRRIAHHNQTLGSPEQLRDRAKELAATLAKEKVKFPPQDLQRSDDDVLDTIVKMEHALFNDKIKNLKKAWSEAWRQVDELPQQLKEKNITDERKIGGMTTARQKKLNQAQEKLELYCCSRQLSKDDTPEGLTYPLLMFPELPDAYVNIAGRKTEERVFAVVGSTKPEQNVFLEDKTGKAHEIDILRPGQYLVECKSNPAALTPELKHKLVHELIRPKETPVYAVTKKWVPGRVNLGEQMQIILDKFVREVDFTSSHLALLGPELNAETVAVCLESNPILLKVVERVMNHLKHFPEMSTERILENPEESREAAGWIPMSNDEVQSVFGVAIPEDLLFWKVEKDGEKTLDGRQEEVHTDA